MTRRGAALSYCSLAICLLLGACATHPPEGQVALPQPPPPGEPKSALGLSADAVRTAFGTPAFTRKDGDAEMWRYDGAACRAFFFLYPQGHALVVRHVETVPHAANAAADTTCLDALRLSPPPPVS